MHCISNAKGNPSHPFTKLHLNVRKDDHSVNNLVSCDKYLIIMASKKGTITQRKKQLLQECMYETLDCLANNTFIKP
jgi:hypothetical protein